ncbi:hypothetical protein ACFOVU_01080 [Nocardiopsis sediminis]|uniref:Antitoxin n=1 Tax=Nocardiopsis sediminis TaxID=1778267 RepID=A0ABV8FED8_9ACTN
MSITIELTRTTKERIREKADEQGVSVEEFVARQVEEANDDRPVRKFRSAGIGNSGHHDTGARIREILRGEIGES